MCGTVNSRQVSAGHRCFLRAHGREALASLTAHVELINAHNQNDTATCSHGADSSARQILRQLQLLLWWRLRTLPPVRESLFDRQPFRDRANDPLLTAAVRAVIDGEIQHIPEQPGQARQPNCSRPARRQRPLMAGSVSRRPRQEAAGRNEASRNERCYASSAARLAPSVPRAMRLPIRHPAATLRRRDQSGARSLYWRSRGGSGAKSLFHFFAHPPGLGARVHCNVGPAEALALAHRPQHAHVVRQAQREPTHGQ